MFRKRLKSFGYAFKGLRTLITTQPNLAVQLFAAFIAISAGFYFNLGAGEWLAVILAIALVIITEAVNTAIEFLTDLVSPDYHPLAGKVKDVAAAAVLIAAIFALIVGIIVFGPRLI